MKRFCLLTSIIALMANLGLYAQEKDTAQGEPKVELKVVYEKNFDEPIVDVIFDTATVSIEEAKKMGWKEEAFTPEDKKRGKILISYPRVVLTSQGRELCWLPDERKSSYDTKGLRFYDKNGKLFNRLEIGKDGAEHIYLSPQQKYILVARRPTEWSPPGYSGGTLYDLDGNKIWEIDGPYGPTPIAVSDEGYAVAAHLDCQIPPTRGGDFYVYDSKGKLITIIENPDKLKTVPFFAMFSEDGAYAFICFTTETHPPAIFLWITKTGKVLWKQEFSKHYYSRWVGEIEILPNKGIIGFVENGGLHAFYVDLAGNLKWFKELKTLGYGCCKFAQDTEKVYISSSTGYLWCFNRDDGSIIWMQKISDISKAFTQLYEQNQCVVLKDDEHSKCCFYDGKTGKLKAKTEYPGKKIFLSQHNGIIFIINTTDNKIEGLKIEEE